MEPFTYSNVNLLLTMNNSINEEIKKELISELPGVLFRRAYDGDQVFLRMSQNWTNLIEFDLEESENNLTLRDIVHPDDIEVLLSTVKSKVQNNEKWEINYRVVSKFGVFKRVSERGSAIFNTDGKLCFIEGYLTEDYNIQDEQKRNNSFVHAVNASSIIAITDTHGKILYVNDLFCHHSKYSRSELMGKNHRIINSGFHPESFFKDLWKCISSGKIWRGEIKNKAKDGQFYWVDTVITPIYNEENEIEKYLSIRNIISEKKHTDYILKNIFDSLKIKTGTNFFKKITEHCFKTLNADFVYIGWYEKEKMKVHTLSAKHHGIELPSFSFLVENTPAHRVLNQKQNSYPSKVQFEFPKDEILKEHCIESYLGIPILDDEGLSIGLIVIMGHKPMVDIFDKEFILHFITPRVGNEINRWLTENKLEENVTRNLDLLSSLNAQIAVIDISGEILFVNKSWEQFALNNGISNLKKVGKGVNYFSVINNAIVESNDEIAIRVNAAFDKVIDGKMDHFQIEYPCHSPDKNRWFLLNVSPLENSTDKFVLTHIELIKE